ncbi:MAG: hypothetical protein NUV80_00085 [Candidatus Berkelbacteria bacterium]|nr:hypothetical protein [Candidatus Berkelbacteria bacterium]MCR4306950.1 hypothetical protein [Candidatus Berkelbacteria bacterium]
MNNKLYGTVFGLIVVVAVFWSGYASWQSRKPDTSGPRQAVFLADGQVYFGYASDLHNQVVVLKDIYYLRSQSSLIPADSKTPAPSEATVDLIKLGDEIYGPTDTMRINRDRINHIEDMKDDSQINQKISDYLNKK